MIRDDPHGKLQRRSPSPWPQDPIVLGKQSYRLEPTGRALGWGASLKRAPCIHEAEGSFDLVEKNSHSFLWPGHNWLFSIGHQ